LKEIKKMKKIEFSKLNGQGNDFILIDATERSVNLSRNQIIEMCNRNFGIGADGIILVKKSKKYDLKMDFYNKDGSISEMCGNGIRCMAEFAFDKRLITNSFLEIETLAGIKKIIIDVKKGIVGNIQVNMGKPEFKPSNIPVRIYDDIGEIFNYKISVNSKDFYINCVSMGNPHCVIFLDKTEDLDNFPVPKWGPIIENYKIFPNKVNIEFVKIKDKNNIDMRVWERGVGETLSCGTGACAAGVCSVKLKKIKGDRITVNLRGGKLNVIWNPTENDVYLEGRVSYKFDGIYFL
jgi:diaminopimelate epimerase